MTAVITRSTYTYEEWVDDQGRDSDDFTCVTNMQDLVNSDFDDYIFLDDADYLPDYQEMINYVEFRL